MKRILMALIFMAVSMNMFADSHRPFTVLYPEFYSNVRVVGFEITKYAIEWELFIMVEYYYGMGDLKDKEYRIQILIINNYKQGENPIIFFKSSKDVDDFKIEKSNGLLI